MGGCYDGQTLVDRAAQRVADDHLAEIDLGMYQVTLPRQDGNLVATTIRLELVATVERQHARTFKRELADVEAHLRHAMLLALRQCSRKDLLEPELTALHNRVRSTAEQHLTAARIESIVFRSFAVHED